MAYMNQERKAVLAQAIAKVMPKTWKYSLKVHHHSTLILTIREADIDLIAENRLAMVDRTERPTYLSLNHYYLQNAYSGELLKTFEAIKQAMNLGNHDRSDAMTDYFDVGWYVTINIGEWRSPFVYKPKAIAKQLPSGLDESAELEWLKNRVRELEGTV